MAFGLIRVREISSGEVGATDIHNGRKYDELGIKPPENIKHELSDNNKALFIKPNSDIYETDQKLSEVIDLRIKEAKCKVKANSVVALEFVCSASSEFFDVYSASGHFSNCEKWLEQKYGKGNVVARYEHYDESTPHAHFIVIPIVEKTVKWKNQKGQGERKENRLCARDLTGNREKLSQLQDDYFKFIEPYGRGDVKFYRGTKASNQLKDYTLKTDYRLGELRNKMRDLDRQLKDIEQKAQNGQLSPEKANELRKGIQTHVSEIGSKNEDIKQNLDKLREEAANKEARRDKYNAGDKWKKGKDFDLGF